MTSPSPSSAQHQPSTPPIPTVSPDDDDANAEETGLQLPLSASLVLTSLPKDASAALREADENEGVPKKGRVIYLFLPFNGAEFSSLVASSFLMFMV